MFKLKNNNIPNMLTIFRIVLVIPILTFLFLDNYNNIILYSFFINDYESVISLYFVIAGIIFAISALTDLLDGYLARKFKWVSQFGKIWDPIADKVVINGVLIVLAVTRDVSMYIPIILIFRDIIVDGYRMQALSEKKNIAANLFGKIKTIILFFGVMLVMFVFNSKNSEIFSSKWELYIIQNGLLNIGLIFSVLSGISYIMNFHKNKIL